MMFFKKQILGLDLGSSSIKIAHLKMSGKNAVLNELLIFPTSKGAIDAGDIVHPEIVANTLRDGLTKKSYAKSPVCVGMFGGAVITKKISMPKMDPKLLQEQLRWEAEQYIPFNIEEAVFDFHILGSSHAETMDVLLVAARQEHIFRYFEATQSAGLDCAVIDVNCLALANCFEFNYGTVPGTVALINIGASCTNLVILEAGQLVFSRDIPYGGSLFDAEISRELGIAAQDAEGLKLGLSMNRETPPEVLSILQMVNETIAQEINNSFDFYKNTAINASVSQIFVSGGAIQTPGLYEKIQEVTQVNCLEHNPFQRISVNPKFITPEYQQQIRLFSPIALGLALRNQG
ncbi:MAG: pilus assembly protein PilM [Bdellovibrionales bacterium]|nr:pilus assembly protein PilM [Bdellovibrionales bacterium]